MSDMRRYYVLFAISVLLILQSTITRLLHAIYNPADMIIAAGISIIYGITSAHIFLKAETSLPHGKAGIFPKVKLRCVLAYLLYITTTAAIMTWWSGYIRAKNLQFHDFAIFFVGWSLLGATSYIIYRKE